jgi:hypothetical protein
MTCWLGRQDSNLGMAESKSDQFSFLIRAHSENKSKIDGFPVNGLAMHFRMSPAIKIGSPMSACEHW